MKCSSRRCMVSNERSSFTIMMAYLLWWVSEGPRNSNRDKSLRMKTSLQEGRKAGWEWLKEEMMVEEEMSFFASRFLVDVYGREHSYIICYWRRLPFKCWMVIISLLWNYLFSSNRGTCGVNNYLLAHWTLTLPWAGHFLTIQKTNWLLLRLIQSGDTILYWNMLDGHSTHGHCSHKLKVWTWRESLCACDIGWVLAGLNVRYPITWGVKY